MAFTRDELVAKYLRMKELERNAPKTDLLTRMGKAQKKVDSLVDISYTERCNDWNILSHQVVGFEKY